MGLYFKFSNMEILGSILDSVPYNIVGKITVPNKKILIHK